MVELSPTEPILDPKSAKISVTVGQYGTNALAMAVRNLDSAGVEVDGLSLHRPSLDDVFLAITGHSASTSAEDSVVKQGRKGKKVALKSSGEVSNG